MLLQGAGVCPIVMGFHRCVHLPTSSNYVYQLYAMSKIYLNKAAKNKQKLIEDVLV